jgi:hypothetical protein
MTARSRCAVPHAWAAGEGAASEKPKRMSHSASLHGKNEAWHSAPTRRMRLAAPDRMKASATWRPERNPAHCMRMSSAWVVERPSREARSPPFPGK